MLLDRLPEALQARILTMAPEPMPPPYPTVGMTVGMTVAEDRTVRLAEEAAPARWREAIPAVRGNGKRRRWEDPLYLLPRRQN